MDKIQKILLLSLLMGVICAQTVDLNQIFTPETQATLGPEYSDPAFLKLIDNYFGCKTWVDGFCTVCSPSYVFNKNGVCCQIDRNCQIYNTDMGVCEQCYTGYQVNSNGTCAQVNINDPAYNGCANWGPKNTCISCSSKYYFGADGTCVAVSDDCRDWNTTSGLCTDCYTGYVINGATCVLDTSQPRAKDVAGNPYCSNWTASGCAACAARTYFDANRICQEVATQCWTWDQLTGQCLTCYQGYDLVNGACVFSPLNNAVVSDPGCAIWNGPVCQSCSPRWVFNSNGACIPVSDTCRTNDQVGNCLTCYKGYDLVNGACLYGASNTAAPTDAGCAKWNVDDNTCAQCSANWVFNDNGICVPVSDQCRTFGTNGACTGCYLGYGLSEGKCVYSESNNPASNDAGCKIWDYQNSVCATCSNWWYFNTAKGVCQQVSNLCATFNSADGACLTCYSGYTLDNGFCAPAVLTGPTDPGCGNWNAGVCTVCSSNWVFNANGACVQVSDQCKTHDNSGNCLSCYAGYAVVDGSCVYTPESGATGGCNKWNWGTKVCESCAKGWVFDSNGNCAPVSDQCRTVDSTNGFCTGCYQGYDLSEITTDNGKVVGCVYSPSNNVGPSDLGCKIWDWAAQTCKQCSASWFIDSNGKCSQVSPLCKANSAVNGACVSCYVGYDLADGSCIYSPSNTAAPTDPGCNKWQNGVCSQCSFNWVFNSNNVCIPVSDQCKTNDGALCTSCYNGYVLANGACELSPLNTAVPTDAGCKTWDWNSQVCKECSNFWYFNSQGKCTPVSDLCRTYDTNSGVCLTCYKGYGLVEGVCVIQQQSVSDAGCANWNWDSNTCLQCSNHWYFNKGVCAPVSPFCKTYDNTNGQCTSCFSGYGLSADGVCNLVITSCKTTNGAACASCYNGYALYQGQCMSLSNIANIALYYAECCPEKLAKLKAEGRIPQ